MDIAVDSNETIYDVAASVLMGLHTNNVMYATVDPTLISIANQPRLAALLRLFGIVQLEGADIKPISFHFAKYTRRGNEGGSGCTKEAWIEAIDTFEIAGAV